MARIRRIKTNDSIDPLSAWALALEAQHEVERISLSLERSFDIMAQELELSKVIATESNMDDTAKRLLNIMAEMAVSGTNYHADRFMPSCESYSELSKDLESNLSSQFMNLGNVFNDFFSSIHTYFSAMLMANKSFCQQLNTVETKVSELQKAGKRTLPTIVVADRPLFTPGGMNENKIQVGKDHIESVRTLAQNLTDMAAFADNYLDVLRKNSMVTDIEIVQDLPAESQMSIFKMESASKRFFGNIQDLAESMAKINGMKHDRRDNQYNEILSPFFPMLNQIQILEPNKFQHDKDKYRSFLKAARMYSVTVKKENFKVYNREKYTFNDTNLSDVAQLLASARHLNQVLERHRVYFEGIYESSASKVITDIKRAPWIVGIIGLFKGGLPVAVAVGGGTYLYYRYIICQYQLLKQLLELSFDYCKTIYNVSGPILSETVNFSHTLAWNYGWQE